MNEKPGERTSAFLDGELDHAAQQREIARLTGSGRDELERFGRYRLIGDVMRGDSTVLATSVAGRVRDALQDEPIVLAPRPSRTPQWLRPVAGLAVAASVAVAAVVVAPQLLTRIEGTAQPVELAAEPQPLPMAPTLVALGPADTTSPGGVAERTGERWQALDRSLEDHLNRLVIEHHEFGGRTGLNGPVAHIGLVSYGSR